VLEAETVGAAVEQRSVRTGDQVDLDVAPG
jgi:hypothetical protein